MTDMEILEILERNCSNLEKAIAFRQAFNAVKPSALNISPVKTRAKRGPNKLKIPRALDGVELPPSVAAMNGHDDHAEAN